MFSLSTSYNKLQFKEKYDLERHTFDDEKQKKSVALSLSGIPGSVSSGKV